MDVLVVALNGTVRIDLARTAVREGWAVLATGSAIQAMREIRDQGPRLVVVQVNLQSDEPLKLIQLLQQMIQPVLVIAVTDVHRQQLERLVRDAGAHCYLSGMDEDGSAIVHAVNSMLEYVPAATAAQEFHEPEYPAPVRRLGSKGARQ
ncbi:MAG: hypothetical protein FWC56_00495 [Phycisphaerae bacterium]|nr:hypothetical protein [Phycisphaerae bacterium]